MFSPAPIPAFIALGSNLGDREAAIRQALVRLGQLRDTRVVKVSPLLDNPAVGGPPESPPYLNAAAQLATRLPAAELLAGLLRIEAEMGRVRHGRWEPRIIDLDLLLYGQEIINMQGLIVPHPLMHQRQFVLVPLSQIAPDTIHPLLKQTISQLRARLDAPASDPPCS